MDCIDKKKKNTEEMIQKFVDEQQNLLKEFIVRANTDFQILKKLVIILWWNNLIIQFGVKFNSIRVIFSSLLSAREDEPTIKSYQHEPNESNSYPTNIASAVLGSSKNNTILSVRKKKFCNLRTYVHLVNTQYESSIPADIRVWYVVSLSIFVILVFHFHEHLIVKHLSFC